MIIWEYQNTKNIFAKDYTPNWSEKGFVIKNVKKKKKSTMDILLEKEFKRLAKQNSAMKK